MIIAQDHIDIIKIDDVQDAYNYVDEQLVAKAEEIIDQSRQTTEAILQDGSYTTATDLAGLQEALNKYIDDGHDALSGDVTEVSAKVERLDAALKDRNDFIRIEGIDIVLGKQGSPYTARFSNQSLVFEFNGAPVAEFTNEALKVSSVDVSAQIRLGDDWAVRPGKTTAAGSNLNIVWIGG